MAVLTEMLQMPKKGRIPLMLEVPIDSGLDGPFLVSSSKSFLWVAKVFPNGAIRAAVRHATLPDLSEAMVRQVAEKSLALEWGSCKPPTRTGVSEVLSHLAEYDMLDVEVLHGAGFDVTLVADDISRTEIGWLPAGWALILPVDRSFVGTMFDFGEGRYAAVLHNASRGVGVLAPLDEIKRPA